jgi:hypothetical protein
VALGPATFPGVRLDEVARCQAVTAAILRNW